MSSAAATASRHSGVSSTGAAIATTGAFFLRVGALTFFAAADFVGVFLVGVLRTVARGMFSPAGIVLRMATLRVLISAAEIRTRVEALGTQISHDHAPGPVCFVGVLKGSFMFLADLARAVSIPTRIGFLGAKSYGESTTSSGSLTISHELDLPVEGQRVVIVEDIADTGLTISRITQHLTSRGAHSVRVAALLDKSSRRTHPITLDYVGFSIPDEFVVGYGLDFAEDYRHLPDICIPVR